MKGRVFATTIAVLVAAGAVAQSPPSLPYPPASRWESLDRVEYRPSYKPRPIWVQRAKAIAENGSCAFEPDTQGIVRLSVPFVVLLSPAGTVQDAHVDAPDCPALEALVEQFARDLGPKLIVPPQGEPPLWRASHFLAGWQA